MQILSSFVSTSALEGTQDPEASPTHKLGIFVQIFFFSLPYNATSSSGVCVTISMRDGYTGT